jgi:hypothetical protein
MRDSTLPAVTIFVLEIQPRPVLDKRTCLGSLRSPRALATVTLRHHSLHSAWNMTAA